MLRSFAAVGAILLCAAPLVAQSPAPSGFRQLAPGVITTIPGDVLESELTSRQDLTEILEASPNFGVREGVTPTSPAKGVRLEHSVQALEFSFKPVRFIRVDLPVEGGGKRSTLVWYLVYYVRNTSDKPFRFVPTFKLSDLETEGDAHYDTLLAPAIAAIRDREDPNRPLLNSVDITKQEIAPSTPDQDHAVWGVVTWDDIDPHMDKFSITVEGLSNAYRLGSAAEGPPVEAEAAAAPPENATPEKLTFKTLVLHFWRPGDAFYEHESEIRYGIPGEVDYRWIYQ